MMEEGDETEVVPLKNEDYADDIQAINITPSAPPEDELPPNYEQVPPINQQCNANSQPIIIQPVPQQIIYPQQPQNPYYPQIQPQNQIVIVNQQIMEPEYEEKQPLQLHQDGNIALNNNIITPSQEQIAAVLPSFDNAASKSEHDMEGIGCIEGCKESPNIITWLLTIIIWSMFVSGIIGIFTEWDDYYIFFIVGAVLYIIHLIETGCSAMHKYLSNILEKEGAKQFIERLKNAPIEIWWNVKCYHYETRTRAIHSTDSKGRSRTRYETRREKVYTWRATEQYQYNVCVDISGMVQGLDEHKITRLRLHKAYQFGNDETRQNYINRQEMFKRNNWRDTYQEFNEENKINGYIERILAESEPGVKPQWMNLSWFWLFSLIGFSPCYRQAVVARCGNIDFALIKQISI